MRQILDAFQRENWPRHVMNPFDRPDQIDPQVVYDAVKEFNRGCDVIEFHVSEKYINWVRAQTSSQLAVKIFVNFLLIGHR